MDRRRHPRLTVSIDGAWRGLSGEGLCVFSDISLGGCFAYCSDTPSVGEEVTITVHADHDIPLVAFRGTVRDVVSDPMARSEFEHGFAVQFSGMSDAEQAGLGRLIATLRQRRHTA